MATARNTPAKKTPTKKAPAKQAPAKATAETIVEELATIEATDDPDLLREEAGKLRKLAADFDDDVSLIQMADEKEAAAKAIDGLDADELQDDEADDLGDIPEEFQFNTKKAGDEREPETQPIAINGRKGFVLTQPSESALFILAARITSDNATNQDRTLSMLELVRMCLGPVGYSYLHELMMDPRSNFDDDEVGRMAMGIINKWGTPTPKNRAEKRRAERARK